MKVTTMFNLKNTQAKERDVGVDRDGDGGRVHGPTPGAWCLVPGGGTPYTPLALMSRWY
jgi:hypothetical protein